MSDSENLTFLAYYAQPSDVLADPRRVHALIDSLLAAGYVMTDGYAWPFSAPSNTIALKAGVPVAGEAVATHYFWRFPFEFELSLDGAGRRQWVLQTSVDTLLGAGRDLGPPNAQAFIAAVHLACATLTPDFGCAYWGPLEPPAEIPDQLAGLAATYPLLYAGPRLLTVEARAALTIEPAEVLDDVADGLLLVGKVAGLYRRH